MADRAKAKRLAKEHMSVTSHKRLLLVTHINLSSNLVIVAKRKLCVMGTETMKTTGNIRIRIAEKISALECNVTKKMDKNTPRWWACNHLW
jgi:hypothetical protein